MLRFEFAYTEKQQREQWIATCKHPKERGFVQVDEVALTPSQRAIIAPHLKTIVVGFRNNEIALRVYEATLSFGTNEPSYKLATFDADPTLDDILTFLPQMQAQYEVAKAEVVRLRAERDEAARLENAKKALAEEEAQRVKQQRLDERAAWIATHGSVRLKKCTEKNYDCARLYWIERAALDYPGWTLDYNDSAAWNVRKGPSLTALEKLEALEKQYPQAEIAIVWLTSAPSSEPGEGDVYPDDFKAREAIALKPANYEGNWLVLNL